MMQSVVSEADDMITITIYDGKVDLFTKIGIIFHQDGNCLPEDVFSDSKTVRSSCYTRNITLPVRRYSKYAGINDDRFKFEWRELAARAIAMARV